MARKKEPGITPLLTYRGEDRPDQGSDAAPESKTLHEAIPYWEREAARWRRHAARFEALASELRRELGSYVLPALRQPAYIDLRSNRYWWFSHMAAVYGSWAARAEQRVKVLQEARTEPS